MLADSSVFSSSPWQNDLPLFPDYDLDVLEAEIEKMRSENSVLSESLPTDTIMNNRSSSSSSSRQVSSVSSAASSVCDNLDLFPSLAGGNDDIYGTVFNHILDIDEPNDVAWNSWLLSDSEADGLSVEDNSSVASFTSVSYLSPAAKRKRRGASTKSDKKRKSSVEQLQHIISTQLGLREQLDVLHIVNPHAAAATTDSSSRFVIDLDNVTEEKLKQVKEYLKRNRRDKCSASADKQQHHTQLTKKEQAQQQREARQRQRKHDRQTQKEKRSGLFKREEVLLGAALPRDIDVDIDILS